MRARTCRIIFFCAAVGMLAGCASTAPQVSPPPSTIREEFDPQTLNDDEFLLLPPTEQEAAPLPRIEPEHKETAVPAARVDGYRVQIAALLDMARAEVVRAEAATRFDAPVYIQYDEDTHLYKLQVGNGQTARDVETLRQQAKSLGYREAYIVRTPIEVTPEPVRRPATVSGYRLQIFSASSQEAAARARQEARAALGREDIYVEFEPPYFKVRIGNFRTREAAEAFAETVRRHGYDTPFPVQTQVLVSPE